ncbi:MAG: flippase [Alphaproteobacteria bacterium]
MSPGRRILGNFSSLLAAQVVTMVGGFITTTYLARVLGPEHFGILGFGTAFLSYFGLAVTLGTDMYGQREIARAPARAGELTGRIIGLRLLLCLAGTAALWGLVTAMAQPPLVRTVVLIQGAGLVAVALQVDFAFQALERMGALALRQAAAVAIQVAAVLLLVGEAADVTIAAAIPAAVAILTSLWMLAALRRDHADLAVRLDPAGWRRMLGSAAPMALASFMATINYTIDIVMLGFMRPAAEVGWYVAAFKLLTLALVPASLVRSAFTPALSKAHASAAARQESGAAHAAAVLFIGGAVAGVGALFASDILAIVFGPGYASARTVLEMLMLNTLLVHFDIIYGAQLLAWNHERAQLVAVAVGAVVNVGLNLLLIPSHGIEGAAVATIGANLCLLATIALLSAWRGKPLHLWLGLRSLLAVGGAAGVGAGADRLVARLLPTAGPWEHLLLGASAFGLAYVLLNIAFGIVDPARALALVGLGRPAHSRGELVP